MAGVFGGLFSGPTKVDTSGMQNLYNQRLGQISDFSNQLASVRSQYLNQMSNFNQQTFNLYGRSALAATAAAGGTADTGAFQSGLGREAASLQGGFITNAANMGIGNANDVNQAYAGAYSPFMGGLQSSALTNAGLASQYNSALGGALGGLAGAGIGAGMQYATGNYGLNAALQPMTPQSTSGVGAMPYGMSANDMYNLPAMMYAARTQGQGILSTQQVGPGGIPQ